MCNLYSITTNQEAIRALFRVINRYIGNLPPMPGVFPDYPAPVVRNVGNERELVDALGNAAIAKDPWAASNQHPQTSSPHWPGCLKPETALAGSPLCRGPDRTINFCTGFCEFEGIHRGFRASRYIGNR